MATPGVARMLKEEVDEEDIAGIVSKWTGIPVSRMLEGEVKKLVQMEAAAAGARDWAGCGADRGGQCDPAVAGGVERSEAADWGASFSWGRRAWARQKRRGRWRSFCLTMSSRMMRIDMSEYMEKHAVARLIGAPPGYVGYDEGGQLTEAVHRRPYAVILFDEIEKAHPDVFNILLQVMDDGRLTDSKGRTVDFKNTVLIMTSNLGAAVLTGDALKTDHDFDMARESVMRVLREHFRPEFLNRVDDTVIFRSLGHAQMGRFWTCGQRSARLLEDRQISLELTRPARELILAAGSDAAYGAGR